MKRLKDRLRALTPEMLRNLRRGIEKESLRVLQDGTLARTPHPVALGSALTHPHITTDFSESQLELITGVHASVDACLQELTHIHQFVYRHIGDEMLWCASMPCKLPAEPDIPIGHYGTSNIGRAKTVYRMGLSHRYGRRMQTISGIHYNFSLPEAAWPALGKTANDGYFALLRNFRRHSWLLLYLFGASPSVCGTFVEGRPHKLLPLVAGTLHLPHATSLRMGPLGYQSDVQASIAASYNSLETYAASLHDALTMPYTAYERIGIHNGDDYRQLSATLLQIENEFYGTVRPKRTIRRGERPLHALSARGVEYIEVRLMDLDPYSPVGITADTMRLLDVFLVACALAASPPDTPEEIRNISRNQHRVAAYGREPGLRLHRNGDEIGLQAWAREILGDCKPVAAALDAAQGVNAHAKALARAEEAIEAPETTPSARILRDIRQKHGSYTAFVLAHSLQYRLALQGAPLPAAIETAYARMAAESIAEQRKIEADDWLPFEAYRQQYLAQALLS